MPISPGLTIDLKRVVLNLEDDLRERVETQPEVRGAWQAEHCEAAARERTSMSWQAWRDDRVTQSAVAWALTTVFVRFCEDNALLRPVWLAGPPERRQEALDAELAHVRRHPEHTAREWLLEAVSYLGAVKATRDLVEDHSPLWGVSPSGRAAQELVDFWRETDESGELVRDFRDTDLSTRFLGDLYQDLSEHAKKTFALLQTPDFVEEFILDQTMEPALVERPLEGFRLIDPTCGSGHFLLGAFARLTDRWATQAPGMEVQQRVQRALDSIHGVDLNPFAVAIARFRLVVAALQACGLNSLEDAPAFTLHLAAGDSLLHGQRQQEFKFIDYDADAAIGGFTYASEDAAQLREMLAMSRYDVVVGNPPYILPSDPGLNSKYRELYGTCHRKYQLTVPFMERFFQLAKGGEGDQPAGWIGQITSNAFMKREFGSKLIEDFLTDQDLRLIVDTSGAYIPGHGTPTVIIVGRPQRPTSDVVRAVLGVRGEPGQPKIPSRGLVWRQIVENVQSVTYEGDFVSVTDLTRSSLGSHPWSLSGGGANSLIEMVEGASSGRLSEVVSNVGFAAVTGEDPVFLSDGYAPHAWRRSNVPVRPYVEGEGVRDFTISSKPAAFPYPQSDNSADLGRSESFWPYRTGLRAGSAFGKTREDSGKNWYEYILPNWARLQAPMLISFAFVATHNHFALDRGGKVFKQSAPVIKLPEGASEDDHLALLGVLNSSTACFWLKQNSYPKGGDPIGDSGARVSQQPWSDRYEFTGTTIQDFPLPSRMPLERARQLDHLAQLVHQRFVDSVEARDHRPTAPGVSSARERIEGNRRRMIAEQEELDWEVYRLYGLIDEDLTSSGDVPEVALGERAFEIALARKVAAGQEQAAWFSRHASTPVTDIPDRWPADYRALVQRRLDLIESDRSINLLERPEHKRRWATEPWDRRVDTALRGWLLDRLEDRRYWFDQGGRPVVHSIAQLADLVARDADLVSVLEMWSGARDRSVTDSLTDLLTDEAVPYLAALRLKDSGLRKYETWEHTWDLQRREDAGERLDAPIPVPTKYTSADFRKPAYWRARGKLDMPKERFILYPDAGRDTDPTLTLGWAGWDHAQQFLALATIIGERQAEGWSDERLVPLIAGLAELMPWVRQWHDDVDATYGINMADFCQEQLLERSTQVERTAAQLKEWRPAPSTRGRRKKV